MTWLCDFERCYRTARLYILPDGRRRPRCVEHRPAIAHDAADVDQAEKIMTERREKPGRWVSMDALMKVWSDRLGYSGKLDRFDGNFDGDVFDWPLRATSEVVGGPKRLVKISAVFEKEISDSQWDAYCSHRLASLKGHAWDKTPTAIDSDRRYRYAEFVEVFQGEGHEEKTSKGQGVLEVASEDVAAKTVGHSTNSPVGEIPTAKDGEPLFAAGSAACVPGVSHLSTCAYCGTCGAQACEHNVENGQCVSRIKCAERVKAQQARLTAPSFKVGDWVRSRSTGWLCRVQALWTEGKYEMMRYEHGNEHCVATGPQADCEPAIPRAGEWWVWRTCATHGQRANYADIPFEIDKYLSARAPECVKCGCLVPVGFGRGEAR